MNQPGIRRRTPVFTTKVVFARILLGIWSLGAVACSASSASIIDTGSLDLIGSGSTNTLTGHQVLSLLWRKALVDSDIFSTEQHHFGTPAVSEDGKRVFAGASDGSFYCFDTLTGKVLWLKLFKIPFDGVPNVAGGVVYAGTADGTLRALRASDGEALWSYQAAGAVEGRPIVSRDRIIFVTNQNGIHCLEAQTGKWIWSYKRTVPAGKFQVKGTANPALDEGRVLVGFSDGYFVSLAFEDGNLLEIKKIAGDKDAFSDVDTTPLPKNDNLFIGSFSRGLVSLDRKSLIEKWSYTVEGPSSISEADSTLYFSTANSKVYAVSTQTHQPVWVFNAGKGQLSDPIAKGNWLFVSSAEYSLLVLNRLNGKLVQIFNPGKGSSSAPTIYKNRAYWISNGETLYSMSVAE
jgi:outer membrane protein assembly factor BamB